MKNQCSTTIRTTFRFLAAWILLISTFFLSCGEEKQNTDEKKSDDQQPANPTQPADKAPENDPPTTPTVLEETLVIDKVTTDGEIISLTGCEMSGSLTKIETVAELTRLINSLPKPVSIPCLLTALPRPLKLTGTKSRLSVQPSFDADNPRVFIFLKDLILAVSPKGELSDAVELSELYNNRYSVKGEIKFPVKEPLAEDYATTAVQRTDDTGKIIGTRCAGCHMEENVSTSVPGGYLSKALRPFDYQVTTREKLTTIIENCKGNNEYRCIFFQSLTGPEGLSEAIFPADMPTLF